jgi:hypothetical protein
MSYKSVLQITSKIFSLRICLFFFLVITGLSFGQNNYPLVTLHDINFIADTGNNWSLSPKLGDTVRVRGTVMVSPIVNPITDRTPILSSSIGWQCYIQEEDRSPWGGINVVQTDSTNKETLFDFCDSSKTYEFTGVVTPNGMSTELVLLNYPVQLISVESKRPEPIPLTLDSCFTDSGSFNINLRKYLGMYVEFRADENHNLITSDLNSDSYKISDTNGYYIQVNRQSKYYKAGGIIMPPPNGSRLPSIRGILEVNNNVWELAPLYPGDLYSNDHHDAFLGFNVTRFPAVVGPNDSVTVTCSIWHGIATKVVLFKRINGGIVDSLPMTRVLPLTADSSWTATIPKVADSAFVEYYIDGWNNYNELYTSPPNYLISHYFYFVLNRPLNMHDIRYSPFGSGYSGYNGYKVKVSGIVVSDTSDIPGNHSTNPPRVYIQNGDTPWSGILLGTSGANSAQILNLRRGDDVTVEGTIVFSNAGGTRIDTISLLTVNSHNNPLPAPHIMKTSDVGTSFLGSMEAEQWNGCLVTYQSVTIDSANADGAGNWGESYAMDSVSATHTRIVWSDGNTFLNAGPFAVKVKKGDHFESITGVLGFTHSNYKLCPRTDSDIIGYVTGIKEKQVTPDKYMLCQNYPNPFNPNTIISYSLPKASNIKLIVYNTLGETVRVVENTYKQPGNYSVTFNASSLPSGIYFYRLEAGQFSQVKKMILMK